MEIHNDATCGRCPPAGRGGSPPCSSPRPPPAPRCRTPPPRSRTCSATLQSNIRPGSDLSSVHSAAGGSAAMCWCPIVTDCAAAALHSEQHSTSLVMSTAGRPAGRSSPQRAPPNITTHTESAAAAWLALHQLH